ncbi:amidase [Lysinibacillus sp. NPDC096418]|uniref:amidase n=1 Tax=Lysinibacillus sp. NPDC096418 TaxID=3364138 RepID=UPI00381DFEEA
MSLSIGSTTIRAENITVFDRSTWIWNPWILLDNEVDTLKFLESKQINKVYLQVDSDVSTSVYQKFIEKATAKGIHIYALAGESYWITENGMEYQSQFLKWVERYQQEATDAQRFLGIHLDIEPYDTNIWSTKQTLAIQTYQQLIVQANKKAQVLKLPLELDIPFWYDEIKYNTKYGKGILSEWLIKNSDGVTIMAYRDTSKEIIKIVKNEIEYAKRMSKPVVIGVETLKSAEGDNISFSEEGELYMNKQLNKIQKHYSKNPSFKGVAIHHFDSWKGMEP